jgi:hypothetical protein
MYYPVAESVIKFRRLELQKTQVILIFLPNYYLFLLGVIIKWNTHLP